MSQRNGGINLLSVSFCSCVPLVVEVFRGKGLDNEIKMLVKSDVFFGSFMLSDQRVCAKSKCAKSKCEKTARKTR